MADNTSFVKSTYGTYLKVKSTSDSGATYKVVCPIQDFPDLGGEPEMLQTTTLSDKAHTYIEGIQSSEALTFTTNLYFGADTVEGSFLYIKKQYDSTSTSFDFCLDFVQDPEADPPVSAKTVLRASWTGQLAIWINGGGVDEVVSCTISITPSTVIKYEQPAA